eukprot:g62147.t1
MAEHLRDSVTQAEIDLDGEFTLEELEECLEQAQFGKACGNDETRNEMFKCGGATMRQLLLRMFNFLRDIETTPDDWGMGTLVNLYKDGDPADLGNYRGIALMSYGLWERLWQSGIRGRAWRIIRDAYRGIRMRVLVDGCLTQPVPVSQGVRQGDPLSPVLFLIFIDALAEMLAERCKGLAYSPEGPATRRQLRSLLYADDIVMLAESPEELNAMIEVVRSFCDTWRIEINLAKSQVMEVHPRGVCRKAEGYYYGSKAIEVVKQYKYLGLMLTNTLSWDAHHERALAKARKGHVALARLFARREIPFAAKRAMWTTTTLSSLEYGAEAKERLVEAIETFIQERIEFAAEVIGKDAASKIKDGDVILTFARSFSVEQAIRKALDENKKFRVIVVDSRPKLEGRELLKTLVSWGLQPTYIHIHALSYVMHEVTKVLIGASVLLSNGNVLSRVGAAVVGMLAHSFHKPLLVCCETYKFHEKAQLDAICFNELGDPDDLISAGSAHEMKHGEILSDWRDMPNLKLLNLTYDVVPSKFVTMVITEVGMIPATSVPVILREYHKDVQS